MEYSSRYINLENKKELFERLDNIYSFFSEDDFLDVENNSYSEYSFFNDKLFEKTYNDIRNSGFRLTNGIVYHLNSLTGECKNIQMPIAEDRFNATVCLYDNQIIIDFNDDGTWQERTRTLYNGVYKRFGCFVKMLNTFTRAYSYLWFYDGKVYCGDSIYVNEKLYVYLTNQLKIL